MNFNPPAFIARVLGLQACDTMSSRGLNSELCITSHSDLSLSELSLGKALSTVLHPQSRAESFVTYNNKWSAPGPRAYLRPKQS